MPIAALASTVVRLIIMEVICVLQSIPKVDGVNVTKTVVAFPKSAIPIPTLVIAVDMVVVSCRTAT